MTIGEDKILRLIQKDRERLSDELASLDKLMDEMSELRHQAWGNLRDCDAFVCSYGQEDNR